MATAISGSPPKLAPFVSSASATSTGWSYATTSANSRASSRSRSMPGVIGSPTHWPAVSSDLAGLLQRAIATRLSGGAAGDKSALAIVPAATLAEAAGAPVAARAAGAGVPPQ